MAGEPRFRLGRHGEPIREPDEYLEYLRRCDRHIADAEGDAPWQAYWRVVKLAYQSDLLRQVKSATTTHLIALGEGPDIPVGRSPVIVGRHPLCDARLDSIRVSRLHCCLTEVDGEVLARDMGSANGIRVNGRRVVLGRLRLGDELSIAHLLYRVQATRPR
jgi:hypothetical protein